MTGEILLRRLQAHRKQVKTKNDRQVCSRGVYTCLRDRQSRLIETSGVDKLDKMRKEVGGSSFLYAVRAKRMCGPVRMGPDWVISLHPRVR